MIDYGCFIFCLVMLCGSFFFLGIESAKIYMVTKEKKKDAEGKGV